MKKAIILFLTVCMVLPMLTSCSKAPEKSEIQPRIEELLAASVEINDIFYGAGLPITDYNDGSYYSPVDENAKYQTQAELKAAAGKVYSSNYLRAIDKIMFEDFVEDEEDVTSPRYREVDGVLYGCMNSDNLIKMVREYDTSTINIIKPSNGKFVTFEINSYGYNLNFETQKQEISWQVITLQLVYEDSVWLLDSPTY